MSKLINGILSIAIVSSLNAPDFMKKQNCDIFTKRGEVRVQNAESILTLLCAETDLYKASKIKARKVLIKGFMI